LSEEAKEAREACLDRLGLPVRPSASKRSAKSSGFVPLLNNCVPPSSSLSFARCSASYSAPTCVKYGVNSAGSTGFKFVRVTGGISRDVGGLCALDAGAEV